MKTEYHPIADTGKSILDIKWPIDLSVIPNYMGINLCAVEGMSWTRQADGQLVSLTIHFEPAAPNEDPRVAVNANSRS